MSEEKKEQKELNEEELEQVSGGGWAEDMSAYLPADHGRHIGMYDAENYIGQKFYIVSDDDRELFYWGTLLRSWEKKAIFGTERTHLLHIDGVCDYWCANNIAGQDLQVPGDSYTLFLMH